MNDLYKESNASYDYFNNKEDLQKKRDSERKKRYNDYQEQKEKEREREREYFNKPSTYEVNSSWGGLYKWIK